MEFGVLFDGELVLRLLPLLPLQNLFHLGNLFGRSMRGGAGGQRRFEHLTKIQ